jgi:hypothetical protein
VRALHFFQVFPAQTIEQIHNRHKTLFYLLRSHHPKLSCEILSAPTFSLFARSRMFFSLVNVHAMRARVFQRRGGGTFAGQAVRLIEQQAYRSLKILLLTVCSACEAEHTTNNKVSRAYAGNSMTSARYDNTTTQQNSSSIVRVARVEMELTSLSGFHNSFTSAPLFLKWGFKDG